MAYVPVSEEPSAYIIGIKSGTVLLDLLGTYVLLDGGAEKVAFTNHIRQVRLFIIIVFTYSWWLAATNGTISLLVWYPAKLNEKIKRVLHTGIHSASLGYDKACTYKINSFFQVCNLPSLRSWFTTLYLKILCSTSKIRGKNYSRFSNLFVNKNFLLIFQSTGSPLDELLGFGIPPLGVTDEGIKYVGDSTNHKMKAMQTRSSIVGQDAEKKKTLGYSCSIKGSDPVLDGVLELVADHSELVDRTLSNGTRESKEKNGNVQEVTDRDFSTATDSHGQKLFLLPPATRRSKGSRRVMRTVEHKQIRINKLYAGQKTRLVPTVHHTNLQAFKTENEKQLEEYNMELSGPLESQITTINGEDRGKIEYHMTKISL
uniref:G_PROTEIN_RECEP_F1_2 domain-containing protein n=1 Tax=Heterorhabditis bacteriophora TaxID=37862 RepID=A0A1I7XNP9_HETBA